MAAAMDHVKLPLWNQHEGTYDFTHYCGADGAERDVKLKQSFKTVFPICAGCSRDGYVKAVNRSWNISGERVLHHIVIFKDLV